MADELQYALAADTYRVRRREALLATVGLGVLGLTFAIAAVSIRLEGGDMRVGILPYLGFVATAAVSWFVLRPLWRRAAAAHWDVHHPIDETDMPSGDHLTLTNRVPPPQRW